MFPVSNQRGGFNLSLMHLGRHITLPNKRDAMSAAVFKKYNVVTPIEGSEEFVQKAQLIFSLNDSSLAPYLSRKDYWNSLPEDYIQRPYNREFCINVIIYVIFDK